MNIYRLFLSNDAIAHVEANTANMAVEWWLHTQRTPQQRKDGVRVESWEIATLIHPQQTILKASYEGWGNKPDSE